MRKWFLVSVFLCATLVMGYLTKDTEVAIAHHFTMTSCTGSASSGYSFTINYTSGSSESFGPYMPGTHPEGGYDPTGDLICNYHRNIKGRDLGAVHTRPPRVIPPTQTPTPIPPTVTSTATATPTLTVTPTVTETPTPVPPTRTRRPSEAAQDTATPTATVTETATATETVTPTETMAPGETVTVIETATATAFPTETATTVPTVEISDNGLPIPNLVAEFKDNTIEIRWNPIDGTTRYDLRAYTAEDKWILQVDDLTDLVYPHTDLVAGRTYYYWVRALNDSGDSISEWSVRKNASVPNGYPFPTVTPTPLIADPTMTPTPEITVTATPIATYDALGQWDSNGDGRLTCAELREHYVCTPVGSEHPAYPYMDDRDNDGVVCE